MEVGYGVKEEYTLKSKSLLLAAAIALSALALPAYAQHQKTPEEKAAIEAARAAAAAEKAAAENPEAAAPVEVAPAVAEVDDADIDTSERTIWDGVFTQAQSDAGKVLYTGSCQTCHGPTGRGGPGGPGITGANLNKNWEETSLFDFYTFAHTNMPPGKAGSIGNEQDYVNVVAYIMDMHGADAGESELVFNEEQLSNIYIVRKPKK